MAGCRLGWNGWRPEIFNSCFGSRTFIQVWLAHDLLWVVDAFSQVPGAVFSFRFDFPAMLVAYGMLLSILLYGHTGRSRYLLVILFLLLIILLVRVIEDLKQCGI